MIYRIVVLFFKNSYNEIPQQEQFKMHNSVLTVNALITNLHHRLAYCHINAQLCVLKRNAPLKHNSTKPVN